MNARLSLREKRRLVALATVSSLHSFMRMRDEWQALARRGLARLYDDDRSVCCTPKGVEVAQEIATREPEVWQLVAQGCDDGCRCWACRIASRGGLVRSPTTD